MPPPLDEWDEHYLLSIATLDETAELEKKGSALLDPVGNKKNTREELAKQVCAFSNAGDGFLVYGVDKNGRLDAGVADMVDRQPIKAWVEELIPKLLHPPVVGCQARTIHCPLHHAPGRCAVVVSIPLSENRPHYVPGAPEVGYIRAGEHSVPMRLQTFLDLTSRSSAPQVVVDDFQVTSGPGRNGQWLTFTFFPMIRLQSGPVCRLWAADVQLPASARFDDVVVSGSNAQKLSDQLVHLSGTVPLFNGRSTRASSHRLIVVMHESRPDDRVKVTVYAEAATPVTRQFSLRDFSLP